MPDERAVPLDAARTLLPLARAAIARELGRPAPAAPEADWMRTPGATFVTLKKGGALRGCIGTLKPQRSLADDVKANAVSAALRDPRFPPLAAAELDEIEVELSVLSPVERLVCLDAADAAAQLRPGVDGVIFRYGHHSSTFLPQVWDDLADPADFLAHLRQKAGLPPDFWDPAVELSRYTVSKAREAPQA